MNKFLQEVDIRIRPKNKYTYLLTQDITIRSIGITGYDIVTKFIHLKKNGDLLIKSQYAWDGATGAINTIDCILASLVHDALYQLMRLGRLLQSYRKKADQLLVDIAWANGMNLFRTLYFYIAVRLIGWKFTQPSLSR